MTAYRYFYYASGSESVGPFSPDAFIQEIAAGRVLPRTYVFFDASRGWVRLSESGFANSKSVSALSPGSSRASVPLSPASFRKSRGPLLPLNKAWSISKWIFPLLGVLLLAGATVLFPDIYREIKFLFFDTPLAPKHFKHGELRSRENPIPETEIPKTTSATISNNPQGIPKEFWGTWKLDCNSPNSRPVIISSDAIQPVGLEKYESNLVDFAQIDSGVMTVYMSDGSISYWNIISQTHLTLFLVVTDGQRKPKNLNVYRCSR